MSISKRTISTGDARWKRGLDRLWTRPAHVVQFYEQEDSLCAVVGDFLADALVAGSQVVVIATKPHREVFAACLRARGFDLEDHRSSRQIELLDARQTLSTFMAGAMPDEQRFNRSVGRVIKKTVHGQSQARVRIYCEMVDVLCKEGISEAAIRVEELWNELANVHSFSVLHSYSMGNFFSKEALADEFEAVGQHARVIPAKGFAHARTVSDPLTQVLDQIPTPIWRTGPDFLCDYVNRAWLNFTGRTLDQELGRGWLEGVHPDDRDRALAVFLGGFRRRVPFTVEFRVRRHDGMYRWVVATGNISVDADGDFSGYIGSCFDIHDRKTAEERRSESQHRLKAIFDNTMEAIVLINDQGRCIEVNPAACELFGFTREEFLELRVADFTPQVSHPQLGQLWRSFLTAGRQAGEFSVITKDGRQLDLEYQAVSNITAGLHLSVLRDITPRKQAAARLRQQIVVADLGHRALREHDLSRLMNDACAIVATTLGTDFCKVLEFFPKRGELLLRAGVGWKPGLVGQATTPADRGSQAGYTLLSDEPVVVDDFTTERRFVAPALLVEHGAVSGMSVVIRGKEGPFGVLGTHARQARRFTENEIFFLSAVANVLAEAIERQRAEEELREAKEHIDAVLSNAPITIFVINKEGVFTLSEGAGLKAVGLEPGENVGKSALELYAALPVIEQMGKVTTGKDVMRRVLAGETVTGITELRGRYFENRFVPFRGADGDIIGMIGVATDITARKQAETALAEDQRRLRSLSRRLVESQESERRHIARELHDEIGQTLTTVKIAIQSLGLEPAGGQVTDRLEETVAVVDAALQKVRDLSLSLRPAILDDLGLVPALHWYFDSVMQRAGIECTYLFRGADQRLNANLEIACFRVAQEAVTNIVRHASATRVRLTLWVRPERVELIVFDNGRGFDVCASQKNGTRALTTGLSSMHERVLLMDGTLSITSRQEKGTTIHIRFPR